MKSKSPAEIAESEKAIESLKADNLIENKNYDLENEDDLAEIIGSAWVNAGNNKDAVLTRLQVLMPNPNVRDIGNYILQIENKGDALVQRAEIIESEEQNKDVISRRNTIATVKPVKPTPLMDTSTPTRAENVRYEDKLLRFNEDTKNLEEAKEFLAPYDLKKDKFEQDKRKIPKLDGKIYNEIKKNEAILLNKKTDSVSTTTKVDKNVLPVIEHQITLLEAKAEKLKENGHEDKQKEILRITDMIRTAIDNYNSSDGAVDEFKKSIEEAKDSAVKAMPLLDKSFKNNLSNIISAISNLFSTIKTATVHTDSATKMMQMKEILTALFPPDEDNTPQDQP